MSSVARPRSLSTKSARIRLGNRQLQASFTERILPRLERHARIYFRRHRHREEMVAETVALAWKWVVRLAERGKDATRFPLALATYAARAVRCGRRVIGQLKGKDVLSEQAQQRHGFYVSKLPDFSTESANPLAEALIDNTVTPPDDQAAFRIDFPAWVGTHSRRDRAIIRDAAQGERTMDLAARYRLAPSRISQLRGEWAEEWSVGQA
jgi:hypothetical protein